MIGRKKNPTDDKLIKFPLGWYTYTILFKKQQEKWLDSLTYFLTFQSNWSKGQNTKLEWTEFSFADTSF